MALFLGFIYLLPGLIGAGLAIWFFIFVCKHHREIYEAALRFFDDQTQN